MKRILLISSSVVGAASFVCAVGCASSANSSSAASTKAKDSDALQVTAAPPERKTLRLESVQPGQIEAFEYTPLFSKLPAFVHKLHVDIGDRVEAQQLLAELFVPELAEEVHQKEAALAESDAAIAQAAAAVKSASAKIREMEAGTIRANADYSRWESQYKRISDLAAGGSVDEKLQDETRNSLKAAQAAQAEARAKLETARAAALESQASEQVARAHHKSAEADLSRQQALLNYTQIRAPYGGVVTERNVNRGDFVQPAGMSAKPLLAIARTDLVRIFADVSERDSPKVEPGRKSSIHIQALPDRVVEGKVTRTSWALGANRTLHTEVDIDNRDGVLRPGMYVTTHIMLAERPNAVTVPQSVIVRDGAQTFCWVAEGGHAVRTPVVLGLAAGNDVEIRSGLKGNEQVIQSQLGSLQQGQAVEIAAAAPR
jgi:HlyD family secretion protein